uniref:Uncharacterized protein n=1 Tax=Rhizophora mucronata TaxID=61149 RepID=A0A2P2KUL6_RHIMU
MVYIDEVDKITKKVLKIFHFFELEIVDMGIFWTKLLLNI